MTFVAALPSDLQSYVAGFIARTRKQAMLRALGLAAAVLVGWALACCLADRWLQLPASVRLPMLGVGLLGATLILAPPLWSLLKRRVNWLEAAAEVERHNPRFAQRLQTVTTRLLGPPEHRGSDDLLYRLLSEVDREAAVRRLDRAVPRTSILLPWLVLGFLLTVVAWLYRFDHLALPRLAARFIAPLADIEPVTTTQIAVIPGDASLMQSQPLQVGAAVHRLPQDGVVWLTWREEGGAEARRLMDRVASGRYELTLAAIDRDLRYRVSGGDARTREYAVRVLRRPAVAEFHVRYVYPAFAAKPPVTVRNTDGVIEAPAGTETTLTIKATEPLQSALLRLGNERILMVRGAGDPDNVRRATFKLERTESYELDLISTREVAGSGPPGTVVRTVSDRKPIVRLLSGGEALRINPRDILPLSYQVLDDFGIDSLVVRAQVAGGATTEVPVPREGDPRRSEGTYNFDLATVKLSVGDVLTLSLVAKDRAGQEDTSDLLQVLVAPRSVDMETHQRINELEAAAQLSALVTEELEATAKAFEEAQAHRDKEAEAASAVASRGNRFLTTAIDTAVLARQSVLRAIVRSRESELAAALAVLADSVQIVTAGGEEVFRGSGLAGGDDNAVREKLSRLLERCGKARDHLRAIAQGERAAAILADRENLRASERRAAAEPQAAQRIRQTLQRASEDLAAGVKGLGLDPVAADLDQQLRAKVAAEQAVLKAQQPIDFVAAAREWSLEIQRDPLRRLLLEDRLGLAAQAEAVRPAADLGRARDLYLCSRAASRVGSDAALEKYAGRPVSPAAPNQFASAVAALEREHAINQRPGDVRPPDELTAVRRSAAEARKVVTQWAGEAASVGASGPASVADARPRYRRTEDAALRGSAELAAKDYAAARASDRELLRHLADVQTGTAGADAETRPAAESLAVGPPVPAYLRRDLDRVEHLTDKAETIDRVQSDQDKLAEETATIAPSGSPPAAPVLADRQLGVAQRIAEVTAHEEPSAPDSGGLAGSMTPEKSEDANWRGRATAAVVDAQEQLAAMPQYLTRAQEEAGSARQAAGRVETAKREAAAAPPERRAALEQAAHQAEKERQDADERFRASVVPIAPAVAATLSVRLTPFVPECTAAREVIGRDLVLALQDFDRAGVGADTADSDRAAAKARQAIDAAQRELARAQEELTTRDPLVAAKWFARAAADSLTRSPPDFQSAYRRQMDTSQALGRAWDRTVHEAASKRLSLVPSMQPLYGVPVPAAIISRANAGADGKHATVSDLASVRQWGRLRTRGVEELNAPLQETEAPGYERALQLYFEMLNRPAGNASK